MKCFCLGTSDETTERIKELKVQEQGLELKQLAIQQQQPQSELLLCLRRRLLLLHQIPIRGSLRDFLGINFSLCLQATLLVKGTEDGIWNTEPQSQAASH